MHITTHDLLDRIASGRELPDLAWEALSAKVEPGPGTGAVGKVPEKYADLYNLAQNGSLDELRKGLKKVKAEKSKDTGLLLLYLWALVRGGQEQGSKKNTRPVANWAKQNLGRVKAELAGQDPELAERFGEQLKQYIDG